MRVDVYQPTFLSRVPILSLGFEHSVLSLSLALVIVLVEVIMLCWDWMFGVDDGWKYETMV